jgi:ribonuclease HI
MSLSNIFSLREVENKHIIFVDGACKNNGKPDARASYAYYFSNGPLSPYLNSGIVKNDITEPTNNRGELLAFIRALEYIVENNVYNFKDVLFISDSKYCVNIMNEWLDKWKKQGSLNDKKNSDMLLQLSNLITTLRQEGYNINTIHIFSHKKAPSDKNSDDYFKWQGNDIVDKRAQKMLE